MDINELMKLINHKRKRQVFFSFDYKPDVFRVSQVRNMGVVEDKPLLSSNEWEEVKRGKAPAIKKWIDDNMKYKSCVVVLIGNNTANKKWVQYEIQKGWNDGKALLGIYIHNLECPNTGYSSKGLNPFDQFYISDSKLYLKPTNPTILNLENLYLNIHNLSNIVRCYDPILTSYESLIFPTLKKGQLIYRKIKENIENWVEEAITIRNSYKF